MTPVGGPPRLALAGVGALMILMSVAGWGVLRSMSLGDLQAAADRFDAPQTWLDAGTVERGRDSLCPGGPCPFLQRSWSAPGPVERRGIEALVEGAGWLVVSGTGTCEERYLRSGPFHHCEVSAEAGQGIRAVLSVTGPARPGDAYRVDLQLVPG